MHNRVILFFLYSPLKTRNKKQGQIQRKSQKFEMNDGYMLKKETERVIIKERQ